MQQFADRTVHFARYLPHFGKATTIFEGSLEVKLPTIWTDEKQSREEAERRERSEGKKMEMREKVGKSRNTVFFQWFGAPEGRKVGSLKRRVRSQLARWEMKNCTPLWREAHFQVKMHKTLGVRTTFGSWDVEKVDAVVARSTFPSQNVQSTRGADHFWQLRVLLEVAMSQKCTPLWREAYFQVKSVKNWRVRSTFGRSDVLSRGRRKGLRTLAKVSKTWGFCRISKNAGRRGTLEEDLQRCISRGRRSTKDMLISDVRRSGRWFPEDGLHFGASDLQVYDLASIFRGRRSTLHRWSGKIAKRIGTSLSALHSTFHFWRKSRRILRFWWLALRKMRKSRRIASFRMLSSSKNEDVSQNCSVLDVLMFKHYGSLAEFLRFWSCT